MGKTMRKAKLFLVEAVVAAAMKMRNDKRIYVPGDNGRGNDEAIEAALAGLAKWEEPEEDRP